jgi:hypothetical protein
MIYIILQHASKSCFLIASHCTDCGTAQLPRARHLLQREGRCLLQPLRRHGQPHHQPRRPRQAQTHSAGRNQLLLVDSHLLGRHLAFQHDVPAQQRRKGGFPPGDHAEVRAGAAPSDHPKSDSHQPRHHQQRLLQLHHLRRWDSATLWSGHQSRSSLNILEVSLHQGIRAVKRKGK